MWIFLDIETSSILSEHMALLEQNRDEASKLDDDIASAMVCTDSSFENTLIVQLLKRFGTYYLAVYDIVNHQLVHLSDARILDLIKCDEDTPLALMSREKVEEYGNECLEAWCKYRSLDPDDVMRICTLILKPSNLTDEFATFLN
jgi:hypothetical protein